MITMILLTDLTVPIIQFIQHFNSISSIFTKRPFEKYILQVEILNQLWKYKKYKIKPLGQIQVILLQWISKPYFSFIGPAVWEMFMVTNIKDKQNLTDLTFTPGFELTYLSHHIAQQHQGLEGKLPALTVRISLHYPCHINIKG